MLGHAGTRIGQSPTRYRNAEIGSFDLTVSRNACLGSDGNKLRWVIDVFFHFGASLPLPDLLDYLHGFFGLSNVPATRTSKSFSSAWSVRLK